MPVSLIFGIDALCSEHNILSQTLKPMTYDEFLDQFEGFEQDENGLPVEIDFTDHQAIIAAHEAQGL